MISKKITLNATSKAIFIADECFPDKTAFVFMLSDYFEFVAYFEKRFNMVFFQPSDYILIFPDHGKVVMIHHEGYLVCISKKIIMGTFNRLMLEDLSCPACKNRQNWIIQFKYGDCWLDNYQLFDELKWGGNDTGDASAKIVLVEGISQHECEGCGEDVYARIFVDENKVVAASLVKEAIRFTDYDYEGDYIIINK